MAIAIPNTLKIKIVCHFNSHIKYVIILILTSRHVNRLVNIFHRVVCMCNVIFTCWPDTWKLEILRELE